MNSSASWSATLRLLILAICAIGFCACAILGGDDEPAVKATHLKIEEPGVPFKKLEVSSADLAWQSTHTGNTIAVNSSCKKTDATLRSLEESVLSGIEHLNVDSKLKLTVDGSPAERIHAEGKTDGVPIEVDIVVLRKEDCTYDVAYVARKVTFKEEREYFNKFLEGFHAP